MEPQARAGSAQTPSISDIERLLAEAMAEILEIDAVTADDNFIELGGNSLLATMLANRVEEELGIRPSMMDAFSCTVAELAQVIAEELESGDESSTSG